MSVATEFAPTVSIPARARMTAPAAVPEHRFRPELRPVAPEQLPSRLADVSVLQPPAVERPAVRLTQRGVVVLGLAVAVLALALVWVARLSAPSSTTPRVAPHAVTVQAGDTLWSIATRVAPNADPQAEIDRLIRINHLAGADLVPGQQLRVP